MIHSAKGLLEVNEDTTDKMARVKGFSNTFS